MFTGMFHSHSGFAYLYLAALCASVIVAGIIASGKNGPGMLKGARIAMVLTAIGFGSTALFGLLAWGVSGIGFGSAWIWGGFAWTVAIGALNGTQIRPTLEKIRAGETDLATKYLGLQVLHLALGSGVFFYMHAFSRL
jgi:hypothetical protein